METIFFNLQKPYAIKMQSLIKILGENLFVDKFINYHINRLKREIARMQIKLEKYEEKYEMRSSQFYEQFDNGELGDAKDYMLWAGIYEFQMDSKKQLIQLI